MGESSDGAVMGGYTGFGVDGGKYGSSRVGVNLGVNNGVVLGSK